MNIAIVPVRVSVPMTRACVQSLVDQDIPTTLYLIDNGSEDGCGAFLRTQTGIVQSYVKAKGLSLVWNRALSYCFDQLHLPYALVVNNDTVLRPDTFRWLIADGGPFVTAVGVDTMEQTRSIDPGARRPHPDFSCFLMRREVWETVGPFDESMAIYVSDCDYHIRMHQAGIEAVSISLPFFHEASGTLKHLGNEARDAVCAQADRDREAFQNKWGCLPGTPECTEIFK